MQTITNWYAQTADKVFQLLSSSEKGLSGEEAKKRLTEYGPNALPEVKPDSIPIIFLRQFKSPLIYLLLIVAGILVILEEWADGGIIAFVLMFNAVVGTIQAGRAQNTLMALRKFIHTSATVERDGKEIIIPDIELVPGDLIILQEGEKVPADARIIECHNFRLDEAALTGESEPVRKTADILDKENLPPADRKNMVFRGTSVVAGNAKAIVTVTGLSTEIGKISKEITEIDTEIPLQKNIRYLTKFIILAVILISITIVGIGLVTDHGLEEMFKLGIAVVVSAIPEGLPVVITLLLASGVWRMSKQNVLVKHLQAVEALGEAKVIAVDKTGTVTKSELVVQKVFADNRMFRVSGIGYDVKGEITVEDENVPIAPGVSPVLALAGTIGALCSNARLKKVNQETWTVTGDPTEAAIMVFASKLGFNKEDLLKKFPQIAELPFDPKTKYHAVLHKYPEGEKELVAGAPEEILRLCAKIARGSGEEEFREDERQRLENIFLAMSAEGLRVIAIAYGQKTSQEEFSEKDVQNLTFIGLLGMKDGLRQGVHEAVAATEAAGIKIIMITGDHKVTAEAVAREAGIFKEGDKVISGTEIEQISDAELAEKIKDATVFARVTPQHKLRLVRAYRLRGEVIAMTGDGVNDALSLAAADLGVAMGEGGTEVAKEAADLVLLDDNFGNIVSAIEEGRNIYKTLKKVILYLFSTSLGEIFAILGALFLGYPLPVTAAQLIWVNFVTDGFLVVALAMEPKEKGLLREKFTRPGRWILDEYMTQRMLLMSLTMGVGTLFLFHYYIEEGIVKAMSIAVTTMAVYQWYKAWNCRSDHKSVFRMNPFENKFLFTVTFVVIGLQLAALNTGFMQSILKIVPLTFSDWLLVVTVALSTVFVDEIRKFIYRRFEMKQRLISVRV